MFSKLRKSKSEKPARHSKLSGMPALKQMRSSKREETLSKKAKATMPSLSELERIHVNEKEFSRHIIEEKEQIAETIDLIITPNYKRPQSLEKLESEHHNYSSHNNVERLFNGNGHYKDLSPGITHDIPEVDEDGEEVSTEINSPWRISNGDSGYKSKDDGRDDERKKQKKNRRRVNSGKTRATSGLLDIKQQRKASRESISQSMRALTPKERESIQCLEDVLKGHPDGNESFDEVFDSDLSEQECENEESEVVVKNIEEEEEEAIDYGYASVNDISRKYSIESMESVGSIIDLVGNLSTSPEASPVYAVVDLSKKHRDVTEEDDVIKTASDDIIISTNVITADSAPVSTYEKSYEIEDTPDDDIVNPEDVITELDDVINSFTVQSDGGKREEIEEPKVEPKKKREKRSKRHKSREDESDTEKERKKREKRKNRDPEKEKERKERKKKKKEEKRARKKREQESEEARRREEHIARQVDTITALTQDLMIKASQQEEPIYAQVNKPKKNKDINENIEIDIQTTPEPPPPFGNVPIIEDCAPENTEGVKTPNEDIEVPTATSSRDFWNKMDDQRSQSPERRDSFSKFTFTSTPFTSPDPYNGNICNNSLQENDIVTKTVPVQGPRRPVSDSNQYAHLVQPYFAKFHQKPTARLKVSEEMLKDSTQNLKHVNPRSPTSKSIQVNPDRNSVTETQVDHNAHVSNPATTPDSPKPLAGFIRHHTPQRYTPRYGRPVSLNLDDSGNFSSSANDKRNVISVKPYSSFRQDRPDSQKGARLGQTSRPFVITALKKEIQLY